MIKSMTGYGSATKSYDEYTINVEVKSVNNRYLDYNVRAYKHYSFLEEMVREVLPTKISRGKVDVFIQFENIKQDDKVITINENVAKGYYDALNELGNMFNVTNDVTVTRLAHFPDIFTIEKKETDKEKITNDVKEVLIMALDDHSANRVREGERLKVFFDESIAKLRELQKVVVERSPETVREYKAKMEDRIREMLDDVKYDEARLLTEVAIFADKVNVTEETVRFESHLKEFESLLVSTEPVGRKLDFTIQELNREANTTGSKCNDLTIGKVVVDIKAEIEKMREQVQNIE